MLGAVVRKRRDRGFTLIELLVVIIILAILAAVVIPRVISRTDDARIAKATSDVSAIDNALDQYRIDVGAYPSAEEGLQGLVTNGSNSPKWNGPYLKNGLPSDPWGNPYIYRIPPEQGTDYDVFTAGPDGQPGTSDDIGNWNLNQ